jgi:hypothetical protein
MFCFSRSSWSETFLKQHFLRLQEHHTWVPFNHNHNVPTHCMHTWFMTPVDSRPIRHFCFSFRSDFAGSVQSFFVIIVIKRWRTNVRSRKMKIARFYTEWPFPPDEKFPRPQGLLQDKDKETVTVSYRYFRILITTFE